MPVKLPIIPPGGFAGFSQQTVAVQALLSPRAKTRAKPTRRASPTRRRTVKKKAPVKRRKRPGPVGGKRKTRRARLVKGSPAAKRHMAKLRRMRRKG